MADRRPEVRLIGLIGLGAMGAGMAQSLRRAGCPLHVFDMRPGVATAAPEAVRAAQAQLGAERAGARVKHTLAPVTTGLVRAGVGQLLVAAG